MASFEKRGKYWRYKIHFQKNGEVFRPSQSGFRTKKEAQIAAMEVENKLKRGMTVSTEDPLLTDYLEQWMQLYKVGHITKVTEDRYWNFHRTIEKMLPYMTLKRLSKTDYQKFLNEYSASHAKDTVRKMNSFIKKALEEAIAEGIIHNDPTRGVVLKASNPNKSKDEKFLDMDEFKLLIRTIKEKDKLAVSDVFILVMAATGTRYSECAGLTWECIDFANARISIEKAWHYKNNERALGPLKVEGTERVLPVDADTMKLLKEYKLRASPNIQQLLFYQMKYGVISNEAVNKALRGYCNSLGIQSITSHGLRHTHASTLLYKKVPIHYVSKRLGHAHIDTTLKNYVHIIKELEQEADAETLQILADLQR